jgi:hypothetical protein
MIEDEQQRGVVLHLSRIRRPVASPGWGKMARG